MHENVCELVGHYTLTASAALDFVHGTKGPDSNISFINMMMTMIAIIVIYAVKETKSTDWMLYKNAGARNGQSCSLFLVILCFLHTSHLCALILKRLHSVGWSVKLNIIVSSHHLRPYWKHIAFWFHCVCLLTGNCITLTQICQMKLNWNCAVFSIVG